jgi:hypothetical protein
VSKLQKQLAAALKSGAAQGSWVAARAALAPLDPLRRLVVARRLGRLLEHARRLTTLDEPAHQLRVAALLALAREADVELDDAAAVELALDDVGGVERERPWWTLGIALSLALVVAGAVTLRTALAPFDVRETPLGRALGQGLTHVIAGLANADEAPRVAVGKQLALSDEARRALGAEPSTRLEKLIAAAEAAARSAPGPEPHLELDAFWAASNEFNATLRKSQLPFFVDAESLSQGPRLVPLLLVSYVEREVELEGEGRKFPALHLWRLDDLRIRHPALGYTRPRTPAALVLLDQIERELVLWVLPAMPAGEVMDLVDDETRDAEEPWVADAERRGAEVLRRHYRLVTGGGPDVSRVGELLARRRAQVKAWRKSLGTVAHQLRVPERLVPEGDYAKELELKVPRARLREWDEVHEELLSPDTLAAFARLRDRYTLSVERHEAQHRIDFASGLLPLPPVLMTLLGEDDPLAVPEGSLASSARFELSAYLAELASENDSPLLKLVLITRLVVDKNMLGGPHSYAAAAALIGIGRELGVDVSHYERRLRRPDAVTVMLAIAEREPAQIRQAAARFYEQCFARSVPKVTRLEVHDNPAWRH